MKTILTAIFSILFFLQGFSQSLPINYQAVIRDNQGAILANENVTLRFTLLQGSATGSAIYLEEHQETTNQFGLVNIQFGTGLVLGGDFYQIDWSLMDYYLKLEIQNGNGQGFTDLGTSKFVAVPYANFALNAANVNNNDTSASNELQSLSINNNVISLDKSGGTVDLTPYLDNTDSQTLTRTGNQISISGGNNITLPTDQVFDGDSSVFNELQAISFANDTLTLSNGGKVYLGAYDNSQAILFNVTQLVSISNKQKADSALLLNLIQLNGNAIANNTNQLLLLSQKVASDSVNLQNQINTHIGLDNDLDSLNELQVLSISNDTVYLSKGGFIVLPNDEVNDADSNPTNEIQALSISADTIYLSGGGFVVLPQQIQDGLNFGDMLFWEGTKWDTLSVGQPGQFLQLSTNNKPTWSNQKIPLTSTDSVKLIGEGKVSYYFKIISDTSIPVLSVGICWDTIQNPTIANNFSSFIPSNTFINDSVINLKNGKAYYFRSFAINSNGTYYGNQIPIQMPSPLYSAGSIGPAGGIIFYDKGNYSNGWRYLEAAPSTWHRSNSDTSFQWGCNNQLIAGAASSQIGDGLSNTVNIVNSCNDQVFAAKVCSSLILNGFNDWFLPSRLELGLLRSNLFLLNQGALFANSYWSSSDANQTNGAYQLNFANGSYLLQAKNGNRLVRPIRRF